MNRYVHSDLYPQFHVNFIKKGSVNDVPPVALTDMGFTEDGDIEKWLTRLKEIDEMGDIPIRLLL